MIELALGVSLEIPDFVVGIDARMRPKPLLSQVEASAEDHPDSIALSVLSAFRTCLLAQMNHCQWPRQGEDRLGSRVMLDRLQSLMSWSFVSSNRCDRRSECLWIHD